MICKSDVKIGCQSLIMIPPPGIELVNIDNQDVSDGNMKLILGLVWHLILHYQVQ